MTADALAQVEACASLAALEELRVHWLGRKGRFTEQLKALGSLPAADKPAAGAQQAAPAANTDKAAETTGGCMPDGSCCGKGECTHAAAALSDKAAAADAGGGCPCMKNKKKQQ